MFADRLFSGPNAHLAALDGKTQEMQLAIADSLVRGETWRAEADWRCAGDPHLGAEIARAAGTPALWLARLLVEQCKALPACRAALLATRLAQGGFRHELVRLLAPHAASDEGCAYLIARARATGAPENCTAADWSAAHAAHPSARIKQGFAAAAAEELDYDLAERLFAQSRPHGAAAARNSRGFGEYLLRTGQYARLRELLETVRDRFDGASWFAGLDRRLGDITNARPSFALRATEGRPCDARRAKQGDAPEPEDLEALREHAEHLETAGRYAEAAAFWGEIKSRSGAADDHCRGAHALFAASEFDAAMHAIESALRLFPGDYRLHLAYAQGFERREQYARALDAFASAFAVEPFNLDSCAGIARCLTYIERHDRAEAWLARFDDSDIGAGWVHSARAFNAARAGDSGGAQASLDRLGAVAELQAEWERRVSVAPATVWLDGRFLTHPSPDAATIGAAFARDAAAMREAAQIALVGNSRTLLGAGKGVTIERADFVIRLNDYSTAGVEADLGCRTDLWLSSAPRRSRFGAETPPRRIWLAQPHPPHYPELDSYAGSELSLETARFLPPHVHALTARLIYPRPTIELRMIAFLDFLLQRPYGVAGLSLLDDDIEDCEPRPIAHAARFERDFVRDVLAQSRHLKWL